MHISAVGVQAARTSSSICLSNRKTFLTPSVARWSWGSQDQGIMIRVNIVEGTRRAVRILGASHFKVLRKWGSVWVLGDIMVMPALTSNTMSFSCFMTASVRSKSKKLLYDAAQNVVMIGNSISIAYVKLGQYQCFGIFQACCIVDPWVQYDNVGSEYGHTHQIEQGTSMAPYYR